MTKKTFLVTVELDGTGFGTFGTALSAKQALQGILNDRLPIAYKPVVEFVPEESTPVEELGLPARGVVDPETLKIPTKVQAWSTLDWMARAILDVGNVSIAELYQLISPNHEIHYSDHYFGWVSGNPEGFTVHKSGDGYVLVLPDPISLTEEKGK